MHKSAFQALKRTFIHVLGLPHQFLTKKFNLKIIGFLSNYSVGRPETCKNVRFKL